MLSHYTRREPVQHTILGVHACEGNDSDILLAVQTGKVWETLIHKNPLAQLSPSEHPYDCDQYCHLGKQIF